LQRPASCLRYAMQPRIQRSRSATVSGRCATSAP